MDIIIIGGGPAGSAAAITAANAGLQTLVIAHDHTGTRISPMESVHPGVEELLCQLGAENLLQQVTEGSYSGIQSGTSYTLLSPDPSQSWMGRHISRPRFDRLLLQEATNAGATIVEGKWVTRVECLEQEQLVTLSTGQVLNSRWLIDASGRRSVTAKTLGMEKKYYSSPLTAWSGLAANIPENLLGNLSTSFVPDANGWTWIAPAGKEQCTWTRLALTGMANLYPPAVLAEFPQLGKIKCANMRWRSFRPVAKTRTFLVGDAAAVIDPASGNGLLMALLSGVTAAFFIQSAIRGEETDSTVCQAYDSWFIFHFEKRAAILRSCYESLGLQFFRYC